MPRSLGLWKQWNEVTKRVEVRLGCLEASDFEKDEVNEGSEGEERTSRRQDWREIPNDIKKKSFRKA
jgi:hypothetical protein